MQIELELLAPAKNKEIGIAAINCGADAVYIACERFGARESAGNSIADIKELIQYAHRYNARIYVTVNTIIYDSEFDDAIDLIYKIYDAGADALIIQDLGLVESPKMPPIPLFASTQCNIRTSEQAKLLDSLGFKRLILARELSLEQIKIIRSQTTADLESFVHGALCVSYSGQCYMSYKLTGRSANRGECAQACRANYDLIDSKGNILVKERPLLSLKDLNLSTKIPDLISAGITSFKIEGRLKNISYVKNIVSYYNQILNNFINHNPEYKRAAMGYISEHFTPNPNLTFNRGYTELFIEGERGKWNSAEGAKGMGEFIGTVSRYNADHSFNYKQDVKSKGTPVINGDGLCFVAKNGIITGARANNCSGQRVGLFERANIHVGDKIFRNFNFAFEKELESNNQKRIIKIELVFKEEPDGKYIIEAKHDGNILLYSINEPAQQAENTKKAEEIIKAQLSKTTDIFSFSVKSIQCKTIPFFRTSSINNFRREIAYKLSKEIEQQVNSRMQKEREIKRDILKFPQGKKLTYLANCSNKHSAKLYTTLNVKQVEPALEIDQHANRKGIELMRTKYCIKYELGLCGKKTEDLFLQNGKNKFAIIFDCKRCEMVIIS